MAKKNADENFELPDVTKNVDIQNLVTSMAMPMITSAAMTALVGGAMALISQLVVTNFKESDVTGDKGMHPTTDEANMSKVDAGAQSTDGALMKDKVSGMDGDVAGNKNEAGLMADEASAMDMGATAVRTKAGASDIETKLLKMT